MMLAEAVRNAVAKKEREIKEKIARNSADFINNKVLPAIAVHEKCYQSLSKEEQDNLPFSLPDSDQSWGEVRAEFV